MKEHEIFKITKQVKLSTIEKEKGREALHAFLAMNPVSKEAPSRLISWKQRSIVQRIILQPMPIAIIIALLLSGGATFAAEQSLPGDMLYPVKTGVNEQVMSLFAISNEAEARLQADFATRRLEEAEKLASEGRLGDDARARIETNFENHAARVEARIAAIRKNSTDNTVAIEVASHFKASLKAHEEILENIVNWSGASTSNINPIVARVRSVSDTIDFVRADAETEFASDDDENSLDRKGAAERAQRRAEERIREVKKYFEQIFATRDGAPSAVEMRAQEKLALAEQLFKDGITYMDTLGGYGKAYITFQESWNAAQTAYLMFVGNAEIGLPPVPAPSPGTFPNPSESAEDWHLAERALERASSRIYEVRRFVSIRMGIMTEEMARNIESYLTAADGAVREGKRLLELGEYSNVVSLANKASELAELAFRISTGEVTETGESPYGGQVLPAPSKTNAFQGTEVNTGDSRNEGRN